MKKLTWNILISSKEMSDSVQHGLRDMGKDAEFETIKLANLEINNTLRLDDQDMKIVILNPNYKEYSVYIREAGSDYSAPVSKLEALSLLGIDPPIKNSKVGKLLKEAGYFSYAQRILTLARQKAQATIASGKKKFNLTTLTLSYPKQNLGPKDLKNIDRVTFEVVSKHFPGTKVEKLRENMWFVVYL